MTDKQRDEFGFSLTMPLIDRAIAQAAHAASLEMHDNDWINPEEQDPEEQDPGDDSFSPTYSAFSSVRAIMLKHFMIAMERIKKETKEEPPDGPTNGT